MNKTIRRVKNGSKGEKKIKTIDGNSRVCGYHFLKEFDFEVKDIMIAYRLATSDFNVDRTNKLILSELVSWYKANMDMKDTVKLAATFYHLFITTKPFIRNNHHMAQILMNTILLKEGYPPVAIPVEKRIELLGRCDGKDESSIALIEGLIRERIGEGKTEPAISRNAKDIDV